MNFIKKPEAALDTLTDVDDVLCFLCTALTWQNASAEIVLNTREQSGLFMILLSCQKSLKQAVEVLESANSTTP